MQTVLIVIHLMIVLALVGVVLIQRSEGGGLGIGGGSGFMSARGAANALTRTTAILAGLFFVTSLGLGLLARYESRPTDILEKLPTTTTGDKNLLDTLGPQKTEEKPADPNAIPTGGDNTNVVKPEDKATEVKPADAATPVDATATDAKPVEVKPAATPTDVKPADPVTDAKPADAAKDPVPAQAQ